ncbi:hypothetical protein BJV78DRAFT_1119302, partial [Lactifluus subvellereus]
DTSQPACVAPVELVPAVTVPFVPLVFKLEEGRFRQLTYRGLYQGSSENGSSMKVSLS